MPLIYVPSLNNLVANKIHNAVHYPSDAFAGGATEDFIEKQKIVWSITDEIGTEMRRQIARELNFKNEFWCVNGE